MIEDIWQGEYADGITSSIHMQCLIDTEQLAVRLTLAEEVLRTIAFDTIAFRGMSGAFLGPSLAVRLGKKLILVRKDGDRDHTCYAVEGNERTNRYVIVDEFEYKGNTKRAIIEHVSIFAPDANFVGMLEVGYISRDKIGATIGRGLPYPLK